MPVTINHALVAKLLNRAADDASSAAEAGLALRKAKKLCAAAGKLIGELVVVDDAFFLELASVPHATLLGELADLQIALDVDRQRLADQQAEIERHLLVQTQQSREVDELRAKNQTLMIRLEQLELGTARDDLFHVVEVRAAVDSTASHEYDDGVSIRHDHNPEDVDMLPLDRTTIANARASGGQPKGHSTRDRSSPTLKERFAVLAALGRSISSIARILTRECGRAMSVGSVRQMMRARWTPDAHGVIAGLSAT